MKLSDVFIKDLKVLCFLLANGFGAWLAMKLQADTTLSLLFGAALNYAVYRINQELNDSGYVKALKK